MTSNPPLSMFSSRGPGEIGSPQDIPTKAEAAAYGLELKGIHREDSRINSWCARIAAPGGQGIYHLTYDPHNDPETRSIWTKRRVIGTSRNGNGPAFQIIADEVAAKLDPVARRRRQNELRGERKATATRNADAALARTPPDNAWDVLDQLTMLNTALKWNLVPGTVQLPGRFVARATDRATGARLPWLGLPSTFFVYVGEYGSRTVWLPDKDLDDLVALAESHRPPIGAAEILASAKAEAPPFDFQLLDVEGDFVLGLRTNGWYRKNQVYSQESYETRRMHKLPSEDPRGRLEVDQDRIIAAVQDLLGSVEGTGKDLLRGAGFNDPTFDADDFS